MFGLEDVDFKPPGQYAVATLQRHLFDDMPSNQPTLLRMKGEVNEG